MHIHGDSHTCPLTMHQFHTCDAALMMRPGFFSQTESLLLCLEIFKKMDINPGTDSQIKAFWDLLMFPLSLRERPGFWPRLPDERLRIISEPDLIYVLRRWGHPNDLPQHGRHPSPPTRGHSKHAWGRKRGGTPRHPQGCLCVGTCAHTLQRCMFCKRLREYERVDTRG